MTDCMLQITKKQTRFEHFQIMILKKGIKFQIKKKKNLLKFQSFSLAWRDSKAEMDYRDLITS